MNKNVTDKINYLEIPVSDLTKNKQFFNQLFNWQFQDYGPEYSCALDAGIDIGFYLTPHQGYQSSNSPLIIMYSADIEASLAKVKKCGGSIVKDIFDFPGGCRFHFTCPSNNEYAIWSESLLAK